MSAPSPHSSAPVVSIVMATYNFERFLPRAIESALAQDYPADSLDIVVIDDGSTDSTPQVVLPYLDRVRYFRKPNGGLLSTVNRGLAEARGQYVSLLSGDDEFLPHKTRTQVDFLESHQAVGLVYADLEVVDDDARVLNPSLWAAGKLQPVRGRVLGSLLTKNVVSGGALMFRASLMPHLHPIPATAAWEDWYLAVKVAEVAELDYVPEAVYRYRYHGQNMNLGARGDKMLALLREEVGFRRSLLAELAPGSVTVAELMSGWAAFNTTVSSVVAQSGEAMEEVVAVSGEQHARSRESLALGRAALAADDRDAAIFAFVAALAEDPWNTDAQDEAQRALGQPAAPAPASAPAPAAVPAALDGVRGFAALAFAGELIAAPEMLSAWASAFPASEDVTLVIAGPATQFGTLEAAVEAAGAGDADGPDMLAVPAEEMAPEALSAFVQAVFSRQPQSGPLAAYPRADDARVAVIQALAADAAAAATR
jgi:hypothetical protein